MTKRIAVLKGGFSAERKVSLVSGAAVAKALATAGYHVREIDVGRNLATLLEQLDPLPDAVFNALHGRYGEDGCIQGLLNIMRIPYTHSGLLASALAMHKVEAKRVFSDVGIPVAEHRVVSARQLAVEDVLPRPYVVKPIQEGSSVGVHIVREHDNWQFADDEDAYGDVMVERFIPGRELTVAVMGDRPLAVTEINTNRGFYDYEAKYAAGGSAHCIPAELPPKVYDQVLELSLKAHRALGCRGVTRADFRYDDERLYILEVNTQPGMTPTSLVPEQAEHKGISFVELVSWMVEHAEYDA